MISSDRAQGVNWRDFLKGSNPALADKLTGPVTGSDPRDEDHRLARIFVLAKHGRNKDARLGLEDMRAHFRDASLGNTRLGREFRLVEAHVRVYEDRPSTAADAQELRHVLDTLPREDLIGQALAFNLLCIHALHSGNFDRAQEHAEIAIRLYRKGDAEFGSLHLHPHLGQIKLMRGDLEGSAAQYAEMEARLNGLPDDTDGLLAVCRALRSEVAYETNNLSLSRDLLAGAIKSVEDDDAWLDVRAAAYRVRTRLAFAQAGLPAALTELAHCERMAEQRRMPRLKRLMQIERLRVLTLSGEVGPAAAMMHQLGLKPNTYDFDDGRNWALRQGSTAVAIARWLVRSRRAPDALAFVGLAEDFAIRGGQLLSLAKLRVIKASAHWHLNQKQEATQTLLSSLRLLGPQPFRRFILDEGREVFAIVQAALDGARVSVAISPEHRRRLSELSHAWVTQSTSPVSRKRQSADPSDEASLQRKYLDLLSLGLSNKEIARTMGVTVNTVKYHLKVLFSDLRVANRTAAVAEGRRLGMLSMEPRDT